MKKPIKDLATALGACAVALALAACDTRANQTETERESERAAERTGEAAEEAGNDIEDAAEKAGDKIGDAADKAGDALERAGEKAEPALDSAGRALDAGRQTVEIKAALMADDSMDGSRIDVDTDAATRTVTLKGTVTSSAQKASAERIARSRAEGYTVKNMLVVAAG